MGFFDLLIVASMPVLQFMSIGLLGAFLASGYNGILSASARSHLNKITFVVFSPALVFHSLAKSVTLQGLISWWYMPVNIAMTFLIGEIVGGIAVKILRPQRQLRPLILATCSAGNLGNLPLILVPAICNERASPFGESSICQTRGLSYVTLSMSLGNLFIWTRSYSLMKTSCALYEEVDNENRQSAICSNEAEVNIKDHLIKIQGEDTSTDQDVLPHSSVEPIDNVAGDDKTIPLLSSDEPSSEKANYWETFKGITHKFGDLLLEPPNICAIIGLAFGVTPWLKSLVIGDTAPLRVVQDSLVLLGNGVLPCLILILGGNLVQGLRKAAVRPSLIISVIVTRYVILPLCGIATLKAADKLGFLPQDPLYHYVLMLQFALPPALSIGTMTQLFDVGTEECSVILMWAYLAAAFALTAWSTVFMWILT